MLSEADWTRIVEEALEELEGRKHYVPGAKLHGEVRSRGLKAGDDFLEYLRRSGTPFRQFLGRVPGICLHTRPHPHTDMLVGFDGATLPVDTAPRPADQRRATLRFRRDVYEAFTRIRPVPYVYVPTSDEFTTEAGEGTGCVNVPSATLEEHLQVRRDFAGSVDREEVQTELLKAIDGSANPLTAFQKAVAQSGMTSEWIDFNARAVRQRIDAWASQNNIEVRDEWFWRGPEPEAVDTPQEILAEMTNYMTEDEVRNMSIPFRAVEEMYRRMPRRRDHN